eukprot:Amastigsp_a339200_30147.p3 type:complete len:126 gc:universal Amastigsp_a339200_30147:476-853(+)
MSLTERPLMLKPTLSPGSASVSCSWCISTDLHSASTAAGAKQMVMPGLRMPVSTRPTGTVPIPEILYTSWRGRRSGFSVGRVGGWIMSRAWRSVGPFHHGMLAERSSMLSPSQPEIGTNGTFAGL